MNPYVSDVTKFKKQVKKLGYSGNPLRENSMTKRYRKALKAAVKKGVLFPTYGSVYMRKIKKKPANAGKDTAILFLTHITSSIA